MLVDAAPVKVADDSVVAVVELVAKTVLPVVILDATVDTLSVGAR